MLRDDVALLDIARAARLATEFASGMDRAAFVRDTKTQSAVLHQLLVLGEASSGSHPSLGLRTLPFRGR